MTDRIDTDAIRGHYLSGVGLRRANWEAYIFSDLARLCDALDNSRADLKMSVILRDGAEEAASEANRVVQEVQQYVQAYAEGYVGNPRQQGLARLALARIETALNGTSPPPADPAPVGLTEDEQEAVGFFRWNAFPGTRMAIVLAALDRLSAAPVDDRERVPEGWRVEWRGAWTFKEPGPPRPVLVPVSPSVDPEEKP